MCVLGWAPPCTNQTRTTVSSHQDESLGFFSHTHPSSFSWQNCLTVIRVTIVSQKELSLFCLQFLQLTPPRLITWPLQVLLMKVPDSYELYLSAKKRSFSCLQYFNVLCLDVSCNSIVFIIALWIHHVGIHCGAEEAFLWLEAAVSADTASHLSQEISLWWKNVSLLSCYKEPMCK